MRNIIIVDLLNDPRRVGMEIIEQVPTKHCIMFRKKMCKKQCCKICTCHCHLTVTSCRYHYEKKMNTKRPVRVMAMFHFLPRNWLPSNNKGNSNNQYWLPTNILNIRMHCLNSQETCHQVQLRMTTLVVLDVET